MFGKSCMGHDSKGAYDMNIAQDAIGTTTRIAANADGQRMLEALLAEPSIATRCNSIVRIGFTDGGDTLDVAIANLRIVHHFAIIEIGLPDGSGYFRDVCEITVHAGQRGMPARVQFCWPSGRETDPANVERIAYVLRIAASLLAHLQNTPTALDSGFAAYDSLTF